VHAFSVAGYLHSVAEWLVCWTQARKGLGQIVATTLSGNGFRQTVHTHRASVHRAAKLVAALLRVAGVTAGLAESNGSRHITCRLTVKNRDQLRNPTLGNRVWVTFTFLLTFTNIIKRSHWFFASVVHTACIICSSGLQCFDAVGWAAEKAHPACKN